MEYIFLIFLFNFLIFMYVHCTFVLCNTESRKNVLILMEELSTHIFTKYSHKN